MTPAYRRPTVRPENALSLTWSFQTHKTAWRWADLLRDMIPVCYHTWERFPGWETRWSVSVRWLPKQPEATVELLLWPVPQGDVAS